MDLTTSTTTLRSLSERRLLSLGLYERIALKVEWKKGSLDVDAVTDLEEVNNGGGMYKFS